MTFLNGYLCTMWATNAMRCANPNSMCAILLARESVLLGNTLGGGSSGGVSAVVPKAAPSVEITVVARVAFMFV